MKRDYIEKPNIYLYIVALKLPKESGSKAPKPKPVVLVKGVARQRHQLMTSSIPSEPLIFDWFHKVLLKTTFVLVVQLCSRRE